MLIQFEEDVIVNTTQIVIITRSNLKDRPSAMLMSNGDSLTLDFEPKELAAKIVKAEAAADTYYFT